MGRRNRCFKNNAGHKGSSLESVSGEWRGDLNFGAAILIAVAVGCLELGRMNSPLQEVREIIGTIEWSGDFNRRSSRVFSTRANEFAPQFDLRLRREIDIFVKYRFSP
jgi:hypothetical protein